MKKLIGSMVIVSLLCSVSVVQAEFGEDDSYDNHYDNHHSYQQETNAERYNRLEHERFQKDMDNKFRQQELDIERERNEILRDNLNNDSTNSGGLLGQPLYKFNF